MVRLRTLTPSIVVRIHTGHPADRAIRFGIGALRPVLRSRRALHDYRVQFRSEFAVRRTGLCICFIAARAQCQIAAWGHNMFDAAKVCIGAPDNERSGDAIPAGQARKSLAQVGDETRPVRLHVRKSQSEVGARLRAQFAQNLRTIRQSKGITQSSLARMADVSRVHLNKLERGNFSVTLETLASIAGALDVNPAELVSGTLDLARAEDE